MKQKENKEFWCGAAGDLSFSFHSRSFFNLKLESVELLTLNVGVF